LSTEGAFAAGVFSDGDGGLIRNFGSVTTSGDFSTGLSMGGDGYQIVNFGSVSTSGVLSPGVGALGNGGLIVNFGDIRVDDPLGFSLAIDATGSQNEVVNSGTITGRIFAGERTVLSGSGNTVTNWGMISNDDPGAAMLVTGRGALAQNFGAVEAVEGDGVLAAGDIGAGVRNTGTIIMQGDGLGLNVETGVDGEAVNAGSIRTEGDGAAGLFLTSALSGGEVTNSGSIETFGGLFDTFEAAGIHARGLDVLVRNTRTGSIETHDPDSPAVVLNIRDSSALGFRPAIIAADTQSRLENDGLIQAVQTAVLGGAGDETVINRGLIIGDVSLGSGDDTYVAARGGELRGVIFSGDGDDTFVFHDGSGRTQVADFEAGAGSGDVLDVSAFGFDSFADVTAATQQNGSDLVIELDRNDQIVLSGVSLGALHENDFLLMA
jgi:hypothetical protein